MEYQNLIGKYLNGYKIVKIENDPFIKGQINLWTNEEITETFGDRSIVKFFIREEPNTAKIYQELIDKDIHSLKQALNEIKDKLICYGEVLDSKMSQQLQVEYLQIIEKVLGDEKC